MPLAITWSRKALKLPPEVRSELAHRLDTLHRYFPEIRKRMKVGITRVFEGLVYQSNDGRVKLMLEVRKKRSGGWRYPTYWTIAHELMHLAQFNSNGIPGGERATDVYALARLPPSLIDDSPSYLVVCDDARKDWRIEHARVAHSLANKAIELRAKGKTRYAVWWESEFERVFGE